MDVDSYIASLVAEKDALNQQVTSLQQRCTEQCELIRELRTKTLGHIAKRAHATATAKGFYDSGEVNIAEKLMLIVTEVAEACEELRNSELVGIYYEHGEKPLGLAAELADVIIRVADLAAYLMIDLDAVVAEKMAFNEGRQRMHGGKRF